MSIIVYNRNYESHIEDENNYPIYRPNLLGNPYTSKDVSKTKASFQVANKDEAIARYSEYFDLMYEKHIEFKNLVDEIYEKYKNGETIYLECYCRKPDDQETKHICHGDIIKRKLEQRLLKEKFGNLKKKKDVSRQ